MNSYLDKWLKELMDQEGYSYPSQIEEFVMDADDLMTLCNGICTKCGIGKRTDPDAENDSCFECGAEGSVLGLYQLIGI